MLTHLDVLEWRTWKTTQVEEIGQINEQTHLDEN